MSSMNPWILIAVALAVLVCLLAGLLWAQRRREEPARKALPGEWGLAPRPVFSSDERRLHRLLREALPQHVILAKLPLVRFCQPVDPKQVHYWFDLLGASHVTFAICSANGRVLAAIDFDNGRGEASRSTKLKQGVLNALRVRYLRCLPHNLPSVPELQMLVPQQTGPRVGPAGALHQARDTLSSTVATRRAQRHAQWQDSQQFPDSFFAPDTRMDAFGGSGHGDLYGRSGPVSRFGHSGFGHSRYEASGYGPLQEDLGGVVVDGVPVRFASSR
jgi:hypothetical protein